MTSSGMTGGVSAGQDVEGTPSSSEVTLALGEGLRVEKYQSRSSTDRAVSIGGRPMGLWWMGNVMGGCTEGSGSGDVGREIHLNLGLGLGI